MYNASSAFHAAVAAGNPQRCLLIFPDCVFSNADVDVESGLQLHESFNLERDLAIGQAVSNELSFALFNDYGDLNDYAFGEFTATLGVVIDNSAYTETGNCSAVIGSDVYVGNGSSPYVTKNGTAMADQPGFAVTSLLVMDNTVYAVGSSGQCFRYVDGTGSAYTLNPFMVRKMKRRQGMGFSYKSSTRIARERNGTREQTYEFVPLGVFIADRPNVPDEIRIDFTCNDRMMNFEKDMPAPEDMGVTYPTTISTLFTKLCQYCEVPYATNVFINSTATIEEEPEAFYNSTCRTVLGWIAEAAGANALFNRDGKLELRWVRSAGVYLDESGYSRFRPYWFETKGIGKVLNRDTRSEEEDISYGTGDTPYLIQDNPLLAGCE